MTLFYASCLVTTQLSLIVAFAVGAELWFNPNNTVLNKKSGDNLAVQCIISNLGSSASTAPVWYFKKGELTAFVHRVPNDGRTSTKIMNEKTTTLMISNVTLNHTGFYRCSAEVDDQPIERLLRFEVYEPPEVKGIQVVQNPVQGTLAKIICRSSGGYPQPEVHWFKVTENSDGTKEETLLENKIDERYDFAENNEILLINKFDKTTDNGLYKCQLSQFVSADVKQVYITVFGFEAPRVSIHSHTEVNENANIDLVCTLAAGVPSPNITWFKDDVVLKDNEKHSFPELGVLRLLNATPEDAGSYQCHAHNEVGEDKAMTALKVFAKPTIKPIKDQLALLKGEDYPVPCMYDAYDEGESRAVWRSEKYSTVQIKTLDRDMADIVGVNVYADSREKNTLVLHITNASIKDEGKYQCEVTNRAGITVEEFILTIEQAPQIDEKSEKMIRTLGKRVALFCAAEAKPTPIWTWTAPNGETVHEEDDDSVVLETSDDGKSSTLRVTPKINEHYGTYTCNVENNRGLVSESFEIVKIERPEKPVIRIMGVHPNKAELRIMNYDQNGAFKSRPDFVHFKTVKDPSYDVKSVDWSTYNAEIYSIFPYNSLGQYFVRSLKPNQMYRIAVSGSNEAGNSSWDVTDEYLTIDADVPYKPVFKTDNETLCDSTCTIEWDTPDDRGSVITHYTIQYGAIKNTNISDRDYGIDHWHQDRIPAAMHNKINLSGLKANQAYVVRVYAENDKGKSPESDDLIVRIREVQSDDMIFGGSSGVNIGAVIAIVVVLILLLILFIDIACYYVNSCGLMMCICVNCCGKVHPNLEAKVVALEEGSLCVDEKKQPIRDVEYNDVKEEANEHTPMIDSDKNQTKKDTTV